MKPILCERCAGNGEVVTDWDAYRGWGKPIADAVAECSNCAGTGYDPDSEEYLRIVAVNLE